MRLAAFISQWRGHGLVEGHFAGANGPGADRRMWQHLRRCETCRVHYRAHALCEAIDGDGDGDARAQERLARGLWRPRSAPAARVWLAAALATLAAGTAGLLFVPHLQQQQRGGFQDRGGAAVVEGGPAITLYRVAPPGPPERAGAVIHAGEALAFSYTNPLQAGFSHLMIFAHDDAGHVYWYWPAWRDPAATPTAIAITPAATPVELGEAVRHPLRPGALTLTALFTNHAYDVRAIETALVDGDAALAALDGQLVHERVEVLP
jgi:hypothetical protein